MPAAWQAADSTAGGGFLLLVDGHQQGSGWWRAEEPAGSVRRGLLLAHAGVVSLHFRERRRCSSAWRRWLVVARARRR